MLQKLHPTILAIRPLAVRAPYVGRAAPALRALASRDCEEIPTRAVGRSAWRTRTALRLAPASARSAATLV